MFTGPFKRFSTTGLFIWLIFLIFLPFIFSTSVFAGQVDLAWDPSTSSDVGGYRLYYGGSSQNYTENIDVGMQTSYTVPNLQNGTYYFAVKAYNTAKTSESGFSNEVSKTIGTATAAIADFSASPRTGTVPQTVSFSDASTGDVTSWSWDFGDGATGTGETANHTYQKAGTYAVSLTVSGPGGTDTQTKSGYIKVSAPSDDGSNPNTGRVTEGQVALYTFTEGSGTTIRDRSGVGSPLDLTVEDAGAVSWLPDGGLAVESPTVIRSAGAANKVLGALQASQAVTIEAWVAPNDTTQKGPARIVALSQNGYPAGGNLMLGQNQDLFETRLRTTATNQYGKPALLSLAGAVTTNLTHVVYTRDASGTTRLYVDGIEEDSGVTSGNFSNWGDYALALANEPNTDSKGNGRPWLGELHLVALYDRALAPTEVEQNLNAGSSAVIAAPVADFSAGSTIGPAPHTVDFVDASIGDITSWSWEFGDGATGTGKTASHTYEKPGTYAVSLTVTGPSGTDTQTKDAFITVSTAAPVADFNADTTSGSAPQIVTFNDTSTGEVTDLSWDFGDGGTSTGRTAIYTYQTPGTYTVSLTVTGPGGEDTETKTDYITVSATAPAADFSASPRTGTAPQTVSFSDASTGDVNSWSWNFGDGTTGTGETTSHTYQKAGTYAVSLTVSGPGGTDTQTKSGYIKVSAPSDDGSNPNTGRVTEGQVALYTFTEGSGTTIRDRSGVGSPLDLTVEDAGAVSWLPDGGLAVESPTVIRSAGAANKVLGALQASQAVTIEAWVAPNDTTQQGPARIVALSQNGYPAGGNFMLGQDRDLFETRLRTTATDQYGKPALTSLGGAVTTNLTHVVYTRDASGTTRLYVDGMEEDSGVTSGNFANWGDYALALANEPNTDSKGNGRPWLGELHLVALYDRALAPAEVERNYVTGFEPIDKETALVEAGEVSVNHVWKRVTFKKSFVAPIVVANTLSSNDVEPAVVRIRNVDAEGFEIKVQEWDYLDGLHGAEDVSYVVMESGSHILADGTYVEAGRLNNSSTAFQKVSFNQAFPTVPVVVAGITSDNEADAVAVRLHSISNTDFRIQMEEQELNAQSHANESIAYIAWEASSGKVDGMAYEVNRTGRVVSHNFYNIQFQAILADAPIFLAGMQTTYGGDTANVRWQNRDFFGVDVYVAEEQSNDSEVKHTTEEVGYIVFSLLP